MPNYLSRGPVASDIQNNYVSQFIPLPLEQFARAQAKQEATQNLYEGAVTQQQDANWKLSGVAKEDNDYIKGLRDSFDEQAGKLANVDLTQRENQDTVKNLVKGVSRNKDLATIMSNKAQYDKAQETRAKMIADNTYNPFNDVAQQSYEDYVRSGGYKSGKSISPDIFKYEDTRPKLEQYVNDMTANGYDIQKQYGSQFYQNGYKGISGADADSRATAAVNSYITSNAGAQDIREFNYLKRNNPKFFKDITPYKYVLGKMLDAANERVYSQTSSGLAAAKNADAKKDEEAANLGIFASEGQNTLLKGGYEFDFDDSGNIKGGGKTLMEHYKESGNPGSAVYDWVFDKSLGQTPKDEHAKLLTIAAKLNGKKPVDYINEKAGPDIKLATTFKTLPTKIADTYQKQFFNPATGTGVFNNVPVMNVKTGEKGTLVEILRLAADRGELLDSKGNTLSLSNKPTAGEVKNMVTKMGVGIKGESPSNYFSAKSLMLGMGNLEVLWDRTSNNNPGVIKALEKNGELTQRDLMQHKYEQIKLVPEIDGDEIHYFDDKSGKIMSEKLSNIKLD